MLSSVLQQPLKDNPREANVYILMGSCTNPSRIGIKPKMPIRTP